MVERSHAQISYSSDRLTLYTVYCLPSDRLTTYTVYCLTVWLYTPWIVSLMTVWLYTPSIVSIVTVWLYTLCRASLANLYTPRCLPPIPPSSMVYIILSCLLMWPKYVTRLSFLFLKSSLISFPPFTKYGLCIWLYFFFTLWDTTHSSAYPHLWSKLNFLIACSLSSFLQPCSSVQY